MSKYRIEFSHSLIEKMLVSVLAILFVLSVWSWKPQVLPWQGWLQSFLSIILLFYFFRFARQLNAKVLLPVIFSDDGQWLEVEQEQQSSWFITQRSRVSSFVLFIQLMSAVNPRDTRWLLIYCDQISVQDYRRLCRGVIFQQQKVGR